MKPAILTTTTLAALGAAAFLCSPARASEAYGTLNNFDTVNDTGHECHGFEIELEDLHSTDISHTYNYNHYGTSRISEDLSDPAHPRCTVRWESAKNPDGSWAAYTAIPSGPISATNGHQFTNPNVNFGGEHFGVGYRKTPTAVRYHWLIDDGAGNLVLGPPVMVSTPTFVYSPAVGGAGGRVQAAIQAPEPPEVHPKEFGPAVWVKEIRTTSHNNRKVHLRDLVSDDPDDDDDINWRNGEPDEIEVEWQILQVEFSKLDGGANNELAADPEDLDDSDDVVTRRYEFYAYAGPFDNESGEVGTENVGDDDIHGEGIKTINDVEVDLSTVVVVGDYLGSQMAAFDVEGKLTLVEQLQDGEVGDPYPSRLVVIPGQSAFTVTLSGDLPDGLQFDDVEGILSGTPTTAGEFTFRVEATDASEQPVMKNYTIVIAEAGQALPPHAVVDTCSEPFAAGTTSGDGAYGIGEVAMLTAVAAPGYEFVCWTEKGQVVSDQPALALNVDINHSLIASFTLSSYLITTSSNSDALGTTAGGGDFGDGAAVTVTATPLAGHEFVNWTEDGSQVSASANYGFTADRSRALTANFMPTGGQLHSISIAAPAGPSGSVLGAGSYIAGSDVTIVATASPGYRFERWLDGAVEFSRAPTHTFALDAALALSAEFSLLIPDTALTRAPDGSFLLEWLTPLGTWSLEESPDLTAGSWTASPAAVEVNGETHRATSPPSPDGRRFFRLAHP